MTRGFQNERQSVLLFFQHLMNYYHVSNTLRDPGNAKINKTRTLSSVAGVEMEEKDSFRPSRRWSSCKAIIDSRTSIYRMQLLRDNEQDARSSCVVSALTLSPVELVCICRGPVSSYCTVF